MFARIFGFYCERSPVLGVHNVQKAPTKPWVVVLRSSTSSVHFENVFTSATNIIFSIHCVSGRFICWSAVSVGRLYVLTSFRIYAQNDYRLGICGVFICKFQSGRLSSRHGFHLIRSIVNKLAQKFFAACRPFRWSLLANNYTIFHQSSCIYLYISWDVLSLL